MRGLPFEAGKGDFMPAFVGAFHDVWIVWGYF